MKQGKPRRHAFVQCWSGLDRWPGKVAKLPSKKPPKYVPLCQGLSASECCNQSKNFLHSADDAWQCPSLWSRFIHRSRTEQPQLSHRPLITAFLWEVLKIQCGVPKLHSEFPFAFLPLSVTKIQVHIKNKQCCLAMNLCSPLSGLTSTSESDLLLFPNPGQITGPSLSFPSLLAACSGSLRSSLYPNLITIFLAGYQPLSPSGHLPGSLPGTHLASLFCFFLLLSFAITLSGPLFPQINTKQAWKVNHRKNKPFY